MRNHAYGEEGNVILEGVGVVARVDGDAGNVADLLETAVDVQFVFASNDAQSGQIGHTIRDRSTQLV